jgi:tripeptide aminopeptidase
MQTMILPDLTPDAIADLSLAHLRATVRVDSQSNEWSTTIPSSEGQRTLARQVAAFFSDLGAEVSEDDHANVVASLPGRGAGVGKPPVAFMVHLDTSRGTEATDELQVLPAWDGRRLPYSDNARLNVDVANYPEVATYVGQDLVFGSGRAPFGLDNKLGLAHMMTLARLLADEPGIDHPPLLLVARPDEEIGRMAAVAGLAEAFAARGVPLGYTLDGLLPFEVNVENFNAAQASVLFPDEPLPDAEDLPVVGNVVVHLGGVNTHGATARAEGHRSATRFAAEVTAYLSATGLAPDWIVPIAFESDALRDCDAELMFLLRGTTDSDLAEAQTGLRAAVAAVVEPHVARGASWSIAAPEPAEPAPPSAATWAMLRFVAAFMASQPPFTLLAEDSDGHDGYSNPFRARSAATGLVLDLRLRDFTDAGLAARAEHVQQVADAAGAGSVTITQQYVNMGPRLADRPELVTWPTLAATAVGAAARVLPIRGGTGVDPFLDRGIPIANLGTGYFAPESEKEFTSRQLMAGHALWLLALVQILADQLPAGHSPIE